MLQITCPWCGQRDQTEFSYGGEAHIDRPFSPKTISDIEWGSYVFLRSNPKGLHKERWMHSMGCRRWFNVQRNTVTNQIIGSYEPGKTAPVTGEGEE